MKKVITALVLLFVLSVNVFAQTPAYYNYASGSGNSFPLNQAAGKMVQWIILPGEFNTPSGAPSGNITNLYFRIATGYPLTATAYTNFKIVLGLTSMTGFTSGTFYTGVMDTVYQRANVTLTASADAWLQITLDHPFAYDNTKSLIIQMEQCSASGATTNYSLAHTTVTGNRRVWSVGGCPFTAYAGTASNILGCGVDISTVSPPCSNFSYGWTTGLATIPDGATNCSRVIPSGIILNDTGYVYIMGGGTPTNLNRCYNTVTNTWSTKTTLPVALATTNGTRIKDSIYVIGGYTGSGVSNAVYKYDPRTDAWTTKAPMPGTTNTADMCIVPWRDSLIICVGGGPGLFSSSAASTEARYYNVYTNTWVNLTGTSLLPVAEAMMASTIVGDTIYIFGGYTSANTTVGTAYRGVITVGSPLSITWTAIANLPSSFNTTGTSYRSSAATIKSVNGGVLIVGGADASGNYNGTAYLYNPCTNTYTTLTSTTGSSKSNMGARLYTFRDSVVYLAAGYNAAGQTSVLKFAARCYYCLATGVSGNNGIVPELFALNQNYPNPFNPTTKISYDIPKSGLVTIKIYDVIGKEVTTLVNEVKNPGSYIVDFNGSAFASGTYFYRLESNGYVSTKKMILIK